MENLDQLISALRSSWDTDTAAAGCAAAGQNKPHGQCAVTALVVQDYIGGTILRCQFDDGSSHYWNLIPGVGELDLTREQYPADLPIPRGVEVSNTRLTDGERAVAARTVERYTILSKRVRDDLRSNVDPSWD